MIKRAPTFTGLFALVAFSLTTFGLLLWLWLTFGGATPLKPSGYRLQVAFPEAVGLAEEADVRIAGITVGKVKEKELDESGRRTVTELELEPRYAPIPKDTRATLRQKTLQGEIYVELSWGHRSAGMLADGGRLRNAQVEPAVELDEVANAFDGPTRRALGDASTELGRAFGETGAQDFNAALGNLAGFSANGEALLGVLDAEGDALRRLIRNTGVVFGALNERRGALRELIAAGDATFGALASRDRALEEMMGIAPTFLDEARVTLDRTERTLVRADPFLREMGPAADDLRPTLRDVATLSPDLEAAFQQLNPLFDASRRGLPALERTLREAPTMLEAIHPFALELNPILSVLNFYQERVAGFVVGPADLINARLGGQFSDPGASIIDPRSFQDLRERPDFGRGGSAYPQPNYLLRRMALGMGESFDCGRARGPHNRFGDVEGVEGPTMLDKRPPCLVAPRSLYDGELFQLPAAGHAPNKPPPQGTEGELPLTGRP